jgi:hypothetical protein
MKIIFSRKGFDSGSGGFPSPLFPDGTMCPLPIPDKKSVISYRDIQFNNGNLGDIVESISRGRIKANDRAHLDPDLHQPSLPRHKNWKPIFGQVGAAQGHLRNQGIAAGDLFLFFGLFQDVNIDEHGVTLNPKFIPRHILWGWLQVETYLAVDELDRTDINWAVYHPHFHRKQDRSNTLYLAKRILDIPGLDDENIKGAGVFSRFSNKYQLTAPNSRTSLWRLPRWMIPKSITSTLSYHSNKDRWQIREDHVLLQSVGRGQEFVINASSEPGAAEWISNLFKDNKN